MAWLSPAKGQPTVLAVDPPTNSEVRSLTFVYVFFGDNVQGVDASDLLINGVAATNVTQVSPAEYVFNFPPPPTGAVSVAWAPITGITDLANPPNAFSGGSWSYTLNPNSVAATLMISEFLTDNLSGIKDENGNRSDWIEIFNPGPIDTDLGGWFLTDVATNLTKWRFPSVFLGVNQYLLVWASGNNRTNPTAPLHTSFRLSKESGYLALVDPTTNVVSKFDPYPGQQTDVSYGRDRVDPNLLGYFTTPTPRAQNSSSGPGFLPEPVFSLDTGIYTNNSLTLTISAPLGTIRYTLNGTVPTNGSPAYTGPIVFGTNLTIKARVFPPGGNVFPSAVASRNYIFLDGTAANFTSRLPTLIISTEGRNITSEVPPGGSATQQRTKGSFVCIDTFRGQSSIRGKPEVQELAEFEYFGQTSIGFAKQPIRIEIQDALGNDLDRSLLGMPADSDWRLRNPFNDKTLLNDFLGFELWEKMGHYSVRRKLVEVFRDTGGGRVVYPGDYYGVMVLTETIKVNAKRVDVAKFSPQSSNEVGYIIKRDKVSTGDLDFNTAGGGGFAGIPLKLHEPKPNELRTANAQGVSTVWPDSLSRYTPLGTNHMNTLVRFLNQMETTLYANDWLTRTGTNHYSYYLDTIACADQMLHVEFTKQIDGYRLSDYYTKDAGGKLGPGPVWDWNLAYGNANYLQGGITNTWYYDQTGQQDHLWPRRLITGTTSGTTSSGDPNFVQLIADRWAMFRTNVLNGPRTLQEIDDLASLLSEAAARDLYGKYRAGLIGVYTWPNPDGIDTANSRDVDYVHPTNYLGPIETKTPAGVTNSIIGQMKKWVLGRYLWMDSQFTQAPTFTMDSGMVTGGTTVLVSPPSGAVLYYTLDGTDPRASGGSIIPGALSNNGPVTITVTSNIHIVARAKSPAAWKGTYSAARDISLYTTVPPLRITEIMYHPPPPPPGLATNEEEFEYIELKNVSASTLSIGGYTISGGVDFTFPARTLAAGERVLVVKNQAAFLSRYPGLAGGIAGTYTGSLENGGERLVLQGRYAEPILDFEYNDSWYPSTDGFGFSLVVVDENAPRSAWGNASQWRASGVLNGTPGQADGAPPVFPHVVINEALTHSDPAPPTDTIELANLDAAPASVAGWYLTDDYRTPKKFRIPLNTPAVPAGGFLLFDESDFNVGPDGFSFSSFGDEVYLFSADGAGELTGYVHGFEFGAQFSGVTFGRYVTSLGQERFVAQTSATLGSANSGIKVGPVVISEIMYRPQDVYANGAYWNNFEDEYVELHNITGSPVNLYHPAYSSNTWRLDKAVEFSFPSNTTIAANGYVLVVNFNPITDLAQRNAFRAKYGISAAVPLFGPYKGDLSNGDETVALYQPDNPETSGNNAGQVPYVLVDQVHYSDQVPWPVTPDGFGQTLHRLVPNAYGDDPTNWIAGGPTPGAAYVSGPVPVITMNPGNQTVGDSGQETATFSAAASGSGPLRYQWLFNGAIRNGATNSTLIVPNVQPSDAGQYQCVALNPYGSAVSSAGTLRVLIAPKIIQQPTDLRVPEGANATFSISGITVIPPLRYQWQRNGQDIPGATNFFLTLSNVISDVHDGTYSAVLTDDNGTIASAPATLLVLLAPTIIQPNPAGQWLQLTAVPGENVTLGTQIRGTKPIFLRWRKFGQAPTLLIDHSNLMVNADFAVLTNVQLSSSAAYAIIMTNVAGGSLGVARTNCVLTVLADSNANGIPDNWESDYFGSPTGADRDADSDGDGMSNWAEYIAGTNPTNAASYLKVQGITATGTALITFQAVSNRTYTVEYTDSLSPAAWTKLTDVAPRNVDWIATVPDLNPVPDRYYRLTTPRHP
jgi:hypothetical protein